MTRRDMPERLASWADATPDAVTSGLLREAAGEVKGLRSVIASGEPCPYVTGTVTRYCTLTPFTLTDAEREAVRMAAAFCDTRSTAVHKRWGSALRGLLERTK